MTLYQLTRFTDDRQIGDYAWSVDGSRLAITLVSMSTDVVLMKTPTAKTIRRISTER
jgi:hypothetical protein